MSALEKDLEILNDDWDRLVALEALGAGPDYPAIAAIRQRWCLSDDTGHFVAGESNAMERAQVLHDEARFGSIRNVYTRKAAGAVGKGVANVAGAAGRVAGKGVKAAGVAAGRTSHQLAMRFVDFADELAKDTTKKIKHVVNKATLLENQLHKLRKALSEAGELGKGTVEAGKWTSKVCVEDKVDLDKTIEFTNHTKAIEARVDAFTVHVRSVMKGKKEMEDGTVAKLGRSTNWAVKRASGIIGIVSPAKEITATCFGGNVIIVERINGNITYAVAKDGDYGHTMPALSKADCERALDGAEKAIETLRALGVKRKITGFTAVDEEAEALKADLKNVALKDLRRVTGYYKSAMALNDGFVTAMVRSTEGLLEYVRQSIKEGQ